MGTLLESLDIDRALTTEIMTDIDKDGDGQVRLRLRRGL